MTKSEEILKHYWGYSNFRPLQNEIVDTVIYGHDTLAILPTGGGKSICFQVPGMVLDGLTVVISPLIALMHDQVEQLNKRGIKALHLGGNLSSREVDITLDNARFGDVKFLYVSPERIQSKLFIERFKQMDVALIAVDEAHCISQWGHDFRPSYRSIASLREIHPSAPIIALTASATRQVQEDIVQSLQLNQVKRFRASLRRINLHYAMIPSSNKLNDVVAFCKNRMDQIGIIYCQTRRSVKELTRHLRALKIPAGLYHGGLSPDDRSYMLDEWMNDRLKVMIATNAFGMGIDKSNVRFVLHYEMPNNLEAYYQEAGRAGRDGLSAKAVGYWEAKDLLLMADQHSARFPKKERIGELYQALCNHLTVAINSGLDETYEINLKNFMDSFEFSMSEVYHGLKILQMNGNLSFNEGSFQPTRLKFSVGSSALYKFQLAHDSVDPLITLLSRSYPGIHDRFISIDENQMAKQLKSDQSIIRKHLKFLEERGVIDVTYETRAPRITFLTGRVPEDQFLLKPDAYEDRKAVEQGKLDALISYVRKDICRESQIEDYFGEQSEACGRCDVCRANSTQSHSFEEIVAMLPELLPASFDELNNQLDCDRFALKRALRQLQMEEIIDFKDEKFTRISS